MSKLPKKLAYKQYMWPLTDGSTSHVNDIYDADLPKDEQVDLLDSLPADLANELVLRYNEYPDAVSKLAKMQDALLYYRSLHRSQVIFGKDCSCAACAMADTILCNK